MFTLEENKANQALIIKLNKGFIIYLYSKEYK